MYAYKTLPTLGAKRLGGNDFEGRGRERLGGGVYGTGGETIRIWGAKRPRVKIEVKIEAERLWWETSWGRNDLLPLIICTCRNQQ